MRNNIAAVYSAISSDAPSRWAAFCKLFQETLRRLFLRKPRPTSRRNRREVRFHCEAPGDLAGGLVVRGARCLARRVLILADTTTQSAQPKRWRAWRKGPPPLRCEPPDLPRQAGEQTPAAGV